MYKNIIVMDNLASEDSLRLSFNNDDKNRFNFSFEIGLHHTRRQIHVEFWISKYKKQDWFYQYMNLDNAILDLENYINLNYPVKDVKFEFFKGYITETRYIKDQMQYKQVNTTIFNKITDRIREQFEYKDRHKYFSTYSENKHYPEVLPNLRITQMQLELSEKKEFMIY